jgi:hypothetical protein
MAAPSEAAAAAAVPQTEGPATTEAAAPETTATEEGNAGQQIEVDDTIDEADSAFGESA